MSRATQDTAPSDAEDDDARAYANELAGVSFARRKGCAVEHAPRKRFIIALLLALLLHAILLAVMVDLMRVRSTTLVETPVIHLRLIDETAKLPDVPAAEITTPEKVQEVDAAPLPAPTRRAEASTESAAGTPAQAPLEMPLPADDPAPAETVQDPSEAPPRTSPTRAGIFRRDGSIVLPESTGTAAITDFDSRRKVAPYTPNPMDHPSPLPYQPTMFEKDWAPLDETALGALVRKATVSKSWDTEGGTRVTCTSFLFFGGCGWGHAPRVTIEELRKMRADPPMPRKPSRDETEAQP